MTAPASAAHPPLEPAPAPAPAPVPLPPLTAGRSGPPPRRGAAHRGLNIVVSVAAVAVAIALAPLTLVGLVVAASAAASLEVLWPLHDQRRSRASLITDLTHAVGNRYLVLPLIAGLLVLVRPVTGLVPAAVPAFVASLPWWAQLAIVFLLSDLCNYAAHRTMHRVPLLWRFHAVHHSSERLDWLATSRVHPVDLALTITAASLPAFALGYADQHPWLLTFLFLYPFFAHANAGLRLPVLDRLIVSPAFHHWHHADEPAAHDKNFGAILTVWDRLLRTAHQPGGYPARYGIGDPDLDTGTYAGHLLAPVTRRR
jgi:sterol desaturase/sphingolipid hydroxylase (fatty acid hydroxylase superfamily)